MHEWAIASIAYNANKHRPEILTELEESGFLELVSQVRNHPFYENPEFDPSDANHYLQYQKPVPPLLPRSPSLNAALDRILNPTGDRIDWGSEEYEALIKIVRETPKAFDISNPRDRDDLDWVTEFLEENPDYRIQHLYDPENP
jgi:hypothetical protein